MSARQLPLDFPLLSTDITAIDVRGPATEEAHAALSGWRAWPVHALALIGPEGAGKTHMARLWAQDVGASMHPDASVQALNAARAAIETGERAIVDNADAAAADAPHAEALFAVLNAARHAPNSALLLTGRSAPHAWPVAGVLRDLASRLTALARAELQPPTDEELAAALRKMFAVRGVEVDETFISYVHARIERSFAAAAALVDALDRHALAAGARVTRSLASAYFFDHETEEL